MYWFLAADWNRQSTVQKHGIAKDEYNRSSRKIY